MTQKDEQDNLKQLVVFYHSNLVHIWGNRLRLEKTVARFLLGIIFDLRRTSLN